MDETTQLSPAETREIKSRIWRNHASTAVFVTAALLLFTTMVQLLSGNYDSKKVSSDTVGAGKTYYLYVTPPNSKVQNDIPFYNSGTGGVQQVVVTTKYGCDTKYGSYQLLISGLTPYGYYRVQTDWQNGFTFGYGIGGHANQYGQATYTWDCFRSDGTRVPDGTYNVLVSDETGFANIIALPVGYASYGK